MYLVLIYDIALASEGVDHKKDAKVLRNVFKTCKKYLTHIQNSVFEGELSEPQFMALKAELGKHLRKERDSCIVFRGRNNVWMTKEFLTRMIDQTSQFL
jgi:CRISPR-associated protein Cas2